jgi:hypothetical protein
VIPYSRRWGEQSVVLDEVIAVGDAMRLRTEVPLAELGKGRSATPSRDQSQSCRELHNGSRHDLSIPPC